MSNFLDNLKRGVGLKPTTRRPAGSMIVNFGLATLLGVISGNYIFKDAIREHFENLADKEGTGRLRPEVAASVHSSQSRSNGKDNGA
mmetsp:Transcript_9385/g.13916  ORF Transcript_9385/g.13916 Transcript_9385/m.13916 type:complete len:87 (-) Transcript_9385:111-371(-)|eukprot:CAMPEP_0196815200 /NCGR_PEP_ID=MMETSP1362-20130617/48348_1 /TAXON_ID=163516 /ORGANISM="Leptocylindrus danicus, Strain CCMP1856" /LENGTH=86 /DNA_ID=CAMNT_0042192065 /DNA_START=1 /DNA_END=261 /DNA_ORIENTATION=+